MKFKIEDFSDKGDYLFEGYLDCMFRLGGWERVDTYAAADLVLIPITYYPEYKFEEKNLDTDLPVIVVDFIEWGRETHKLDFFKTPRVFGSSDMEDILSVDGRKEYLKLHNHLKKIDVKCYFMREMVTDDIYPDYVEPIDYPNLCPYINPAPSKPIKLTWIYGISNVDRQVFYGHLNAQFGKSEFGEHYCNSFKQVEDFLEHNREDITLTCRCEHFERIPIEKVLYLSTQSKFMVDLWGNGAKCFRNTESLYHTVSLKQDYSKFRFRIPFVDGENCIFLPNEVFDDSYRLSMSDSMGLLSDLFKGETDYDLEKIQANGFDTFDKYQAKSYFENELTPLVEK